MVILSSAYLLIVGMRSDSEHVVVLSCLRLTATLPSLYLILSLSWNDDISSEMRRQLHKEFPGRVHCD